MARLSLTAILVRDYDEAIDWYTNVLGFRLVADDDQGGGKRWVTIEDEAGRGLVLAKANKPEELAVVGGNDTAYQECEVETKQSAINGRPCTLIEVVHPIPRQNFRFHKAEIFIDNELKLPIRYAAYMWPANPGEQPPLEEAYTYLNIKLNNGYTDADFDKNNGEYFK